MNILITGDLTLGGCAGPYRTVRGEKVRNPYCGPKCRKMHLPYQDRAELWTSMQRALARWTLAENTVTVTEGPGAPAMASFMLGIRKDDKLPIREAFATRHDVVLMITEHRLGRNTDNFTRSMLRHAADADNEPYIINVALAEHIARWVPRTHWLLNEGLREAEERHEQTSSGPDTTDWDTAVRPEATLHADDDRTGGWTDRRGYDGKAIQHGAEALSGLVDWLRKPLTELVSEGWLEATVDWDTYQRGLTPMPEWHPRPLITREIAVTCEKCHNFFTHDDTMGFPCPRCGTTTTLAPTYIFAYDYVNQRVRTA